MKRILTFILSIFSLNTAIANLSDVPLVSAEDVNKNRDRYIVLDVRSEKEYAAGHIPGAINIPHTQVEENIAEIKGWENKTIVVHCKSGYRAGIAESILQSNAINNVAHLEGDFKGWQKLELPLDKVN